jgi:hypothetical protein
MYIVTDKVKCYYIPTYNAIKYVQNGPFMWPAIFQMDCNIFKYSEFQLVFFIWSYHLGKANGMIKKKLPENLAIKLPFITPNTASLC